MVEESSENLLENNNNLESDTPPLESKFPQREKGYNKKEGGNKKPTKNIGLRKEDPAKKGRKRKKKQIKNKKNIKKKRSPKKGRKKKQTKNESEKVIGEEVFSTIDSHEVAAVNVAREELTLRHSSSLTLKIFVMFTLVSIMVFLSVGYAYPAAQEDVSEIVLVRGDGSFDRGLFTQFYISIAFTLCTLLLGFYVNSTFVRFGMKNWNIFALAILLMFFYGLGKIGELIYNHELFAMFDDLIHPMALMVLAFASYKICKEFKERRQNGC